MKIVFVSNFFNHHQKPLADAMFALLGEGYHFIETEPITAGRLKLGWGKDTKPSYVKQTYTSVENMAECKRIINEADVVILGSAPYELLTARLKEKKLTFKCSERKYKTKCPLWKLPHHFLINYKKYIRHKNVYLLAASAFSSADYAKTLCFKNRAYKWAYFTALKQYTSIDALIDAKRPSTITWVARLVGVKHPEIPVEIARRLKEDGYTFTLNMIGTGELEESIQASIKEQGLSDCVHLLGAMSPEEVRTHMEESEIFLFTSDKGEGWGAVLNEAMNSACACVASHVIGSVPFLIEDEKNGFIYRNDDLDDLYSKVKFLLDNQERRKKMAKFAYETMKNEWNAENAAHRFITLVQKLLDGEKHPFPYASGICSRASVLKDDWK